MSLKFWLTLLRVLSAELSEINEAGVLTVESFEATIVTVLIHYEARNLRRVDGPLFNNYITGAFIDFN
jgi:hypothetical protein